MREYIRVRGRGQRTLPFNAEEIIPWLEFHDWAHLFPTVVAYTSYSDGQGPWKQLRVIMAPWTTRMKNGVVHFSGRGGIVV